jgi:hypothetical protein
MIRNIAGGISLATILALGACTNESRYGHSSSDGYMNRQNRSDNANSGDANYSGREYNSSGGYNSSGSGYNSSGGSRSGMNQGTSGYSGSSNMSNMSGTSSMQSIAGLTDNDISSIPESDMPSGARTYFSREANGTMLSETGKAMWNGKQVYSARIMKNGHPYRVITEADGTLISMRRLD